MREALWTEVLKARRSWLPWLTAAAFALITAVGGLFMFILQNPQRARSLGLLGTKAELAGGRADWPTYLAFQAQTVAVGGMVIFGVTTIWLFGREFSDRTAKDLLALPTSRTAIVAAKLLLGFAWSFVLAVEVLLLGLLIGRTLGLPDWSSTVASQGAVRLMATTVMTRALVAALALAASVGRGYLAAIGVMFAVVFTSQIVAALGYGHLFPWSVPAVYSGLAGPDQPNVGPLGFLTVAVVAVICTAATGLWWRRADHSDR